MRETRCVADEVTDDVTDEVTCAQQSLVGHRELELRVTLFLSPLWAGFPLKCSKL